MNRELDSVKGRRILFVAPRFHASILGGADQFTYVLARKLAEGGAHVRVLTTRTLRFEPRDELRIDWPRQLPAGLGIEDGIEVERFDTLPLPAAFARRAAPFVRRRLAAELAHACTDLGRPAFGVGWYGQECWDGQFPVRWSSARSEVHLASVSVNGVALTCHAPFEQRITILACTGRRSRTLGMLELVPGAWARLALAFEARKIDKLVFVSERTKVPGPQDSRSLAFVISEAEVWMADGKSATLRPDERPEEVLDSLDDDAFASTWIPVAKRRPAAYGWAYAGLRGPVSTGLFRACIRQAPAADLVVASGFPFLTVHYGLWAAKIARVPVYLLPFLHDRDVTHNWRHLLGAVRKATGALALSHYQRDYFQRVLGGRGIFIGAGSPQWAGSALRAPPAQEESGAGGADAADRFRLLFLGRRTAYKGIDKAVRIVRRLRAGGHDVRLGIAGPAEGYELEAEPGIEDLGVVDADRLAALLTEFDALILPSRHESFGLVVIEAWMCGRPVLAERASGSLRTLIADGQDGFLCSTEEDYANRILELMQDRELWLRMGRAGRAKVEATYNWDSVRRRFCSILAGEQPRR